MRATPTQVSYSSWARPGPLCHCSALKPSLGQSRAGLRLAWVLLQGLGRPRQRAVPGPTCGGNVSYGVAVTTASMALCSFQPRAGLCLQGLLEKAEGLRARREAQAAGAGARWAEMPSCRLGPLLLPKRPNTLDGDGAPVWTPGSNKYSGPTE